METAVREAVLHNNAAALAAERQAARPILLRWQKAIEAAVTRRRLQEVDYRLASALANFPSANRGGCYPGHKWLAERLGRSERTVRYALDRLTRAGFLSKRRRGQGLTSAYTFLLDGKGLFSGVGCAVTANVVPFESKGIAYQERQGIASQERQRVADKPSESEPFESISPPTPRPASPVSPDGCPIVNLEGERRARRPPFTFNELREIWTPIKGEPWGPASRLFDRLSAGDKWAIEDLIRRNGGWLDTEGTWLCTWIRHRRWEMPRQEANSSVSLNPVTEIEIPGWIFIEEDTPEWKRRTQIALDADRILPRSNIDRNGKSGRYFRIEART